MQGLKRVIDGEAISKPRHDPRVGFLVHLGGQEEGVAPEANPHGVLETLHLVTMQEVTLQLVHRHLLCVLTDQGPGGGHLGLHVGVIVHALIIPITAKTLADTKITESG